MNKQEIIEVLTELHKITGFRVSLHGASYEEIAAYPANDLPLCAIVNASQAERAKCLECNRIAFEKALKKGGTYIYKCRFGLTEAVSPLYNFGKLAGFLQVGQIAESEADRRYALDTLERIEGSKINAEYVSVAKDETIGSYVKIMTICAQYLMLQNAISTVKPTVAEQAKKYIRENISRKFVIGDICDKLKCSKSTLLTTFKKQYGITVNSYVTEERLNMAVRLLGNSDMTISEIASETGFSDQSYFSKVFSARYGITPSEYRTGTKNDS